MDKHIKPPSLCTYFTQDGKSAKKRFDNILNTKKKKTGVIAFLLIICVISVCGTLVACEKGIVQKKEKNQIEKLYDSKLKYVGNASGVGKILELCPPIDNMVYDSLELQTEKEPYGIIRNCTFRGDKVDEIQLQKQVCIVLSLVENAGYMEFVINGEKYTYNRNDFNSQFDKNLLEYNKDLDSFSEFINSVYSLKSEDDIEKIISKIILDENTNKYKKAECMAEGHIILGNQKSETGTEFYVLAMYGEYEFQNGNFVKSSGSGVIPVRITLDEKNTLLEYLSASDGALYQPSVNKMFPKEYQKRALIHNEEDNEECQRQERAYAQDYLAKIGRNAKIGDYRDFEYQYSKLDISDDAIKQYGEYPRWIGTLEKTQNSVRYVYEKSQKDTGNNKATITLKKYEYETKKVVEEIEFEVMENGQVLKSIKTMPKEKR